MYLGIEIGGTKLQLGLGPGDGTIHALWRGAVVPADGADGIRQQIEVAIPQLLANAKRGKDELKGAGIGFASQAMSMLPYLATVAVLVLISRNAAMVRLNTPVSLGKPFHAGA